MLHSPGDPYANAFVSEVGQCWRMVHDRQGSHALLGDADLDGAVVRSLGERWCPVWACPDHIEGPTGLREFGRRRGAAS